MLDTRPGPLTPDAPLEDLGPLAWVFDELRKSLDAATKAVRRFVRESEQSRHSDLEAVDPASLRIARQQLHQAVGALEMVGLGAPAQVLRAMEAAVQRFVQKPQHCTEAAAGQVERAGFALIEYLEAVLRNKPVQPVALFPQYKDVQTLAGAERIHPADLWPFDRRGQSVSPPEVKPLQADAQLRSMLDRLVLLLVKTHSPAAALQLSRLCAGLSAGAPVTRQTTFWRVAAGFFEAVSLGLLPADAYVKRAASRILLQFVALAPGGAGKGELSETLLHDLLFFCSQSCPADAAKAPNLTAVREAFGLQDEGRADYSQASLGRFDPALLVQARKRVNAAKESWSLYAGGDVNRARQVTDQFGLVGDSLSRLLPSGAVLAQSLVRAAEQAARHPHGLRPELSMEVATTTLYLEAVFEDFDPAQQDLTDRAQALAARLDQVLAGEPAQPLEAWMEQLYRRVSDRQTMGSVVGELKASLGEAEKSLDQFFRNPVEKAGLHVAVSQLAQMRGVMSVLGLEQGVQTVTRMRNAVEEILDTAVDEEKAREAGTFQHLGNNLSALGFMVDMLNYQPALAKKLFMFDESVGELVPLMGRSVGQPGSETPAPAKAQEVRAISEAVHEVVQNVQNAQDSVDIAGLSQKLDTLADQASLVDNEGVAKAARDAAHALVQDDASAGAQALVELSQAAAPVAEAAQDLETVTSHPQLGVPSDAEGGDEELLDIFLEEAREVLANGREAVRELQGAPSDLESLTTLRRAFHTLKGSSRMVGLIEFGDAGWAMEQVLNAVLAEQKPAESGLLSLSEEALEAFGQWVEDISGKSDSAWRAAPFRTSGEAWRAEGRYVPLSAVPAASGETVSPALAVEPSSGFAETEPLDIDFDMPAPEPSPDFLAEPPAMLADIDFSSLASIAQPATAVDAMTVPPEEPAVGPVVEPVVETVQEPVAEPFTAAAEADALPSIFDGISLDLETDLPQITGLQDGQPNLVPDLLPGEPATPDLSPVAAVDSPVPDEPAVDAVAFHPLGANTSAEQADATEGSAADLPEPLAEADAMAASPDDAGSDEEVKVIGPLRIGIKLYNVFLNEADEWSRRLCTCMGEWALEHHQVVPEQGEALAHSLAGAAATVGFQPLSGIARSLEHAIAAVSSHQTNGIPATAEQAQLFVDASEDIRRLLHQFAAGFFKEPQPALLSALDSVIHDEVMPSPEASPETDGAEEVAEPLADQGLDITLNTQWGMDQAATPPAGVRVVMPDETPSAFAPPDFGSSTFDDGATVFAPMLPVLKRGPVQDIDDDIDALDTIDVDLFPIFAEEALELLPQLGGALRQWTARPENLSARAEVLRTLHTLKGSARLAGALRLGEMAHRLETEAERLGSEGLTSREVEPLLVSFDAIAARFDLLRNTDPDSHDVIQTAAELSPHRDSEPGALPSEPALSLPPLDPWELPPADLLPAGESASETPFEVQTEPVLRDEAVQSMDGSGHESMPEPLDASAFDERAHVGGSAADMEAEPGASAPSAPVADAPAPAGLTGLALPAPPVAAAARTSAAVRVRPELLDRLVNQTGEVMISRSRMEAELHTLRGSLRDLTGNLERLRQQLRDLELQAETQMQSRLAQARDADQSFDPLEFDRFTRVQELTRMMAESVNDVATVQRNLQRAVESTEDGLVAQARQTRELQRDLLRTRMVEFEGISERLYRVVRQASKETGKQVRLDISGGQIEMDRGVLDRMTAAFEHLLRNSVVHGIEPLEERLAKGKPAEGRIDIRLSQELNDVSVVFEDDGAGLDLDRLREKARAQGLVAPDADLPDDVAAQLVFLPGLSTARDVTSLAGRGVGMDVVRNDVIALGGRIETGTRAGRGARFKLILPLTTAVTQVVMVRAGSLTFGVPSNLVEVVRRMTPDELDAAYSSAQLNVAGEMLPFYWSGALLQSSPRSVELKGRTLPVVIFRSAAQRVAMHVDEVLGNQEVVVKNLGPQLSRLPGLAGMSVLASGAVALIYNPVALATVYGAQVPQWVASQSHAVADASGETALAEPLVSNVPLVLVVDDSITVRRVTQRLLQREGYRVSLAADGLQALERLQQERPAVVLSDIEMPRMDGFDLVRNIRSDARLSDLPVIMITSRIAEKHREHARELGVDHYLGKPYAEDELLALIAHYARTTAEA